MSDVVSSVQQSVLSDAPLKSVEGATVPNVINLLNHGHIRLIDSMGSDLSVVRSARVSYDAEWRAGEDEGKDTKLIDYLVKNYHTSPLESVVFAFEVKAPIFVFRQWQRHRTQSYSEQSARYSVLTDEFYIPEVSQITSQSVNNKQQRTDEVIEDAEFYQKLISINCETSFNTYHDLLKGGVPRELARGVLPVNTYSKMFTTLNLLNLAKFIKLRSHPHAQYEIKVYSDAALEFAKRVAPVTMAAVERHWL